MSKVINLRGTSGSGKSFIVREMMSRYPDVERHHVSIRKQPYAYTCRRPDGKSLYVVGHYETACGGADTISKEFEFEGVVRNGMELVYAMVESAASKGHDVIFEGLIVASDVKRCIDLKNRYDLLVIRLTTSIEECGRSIQARRDAKGDERPLSLRNTELKYRALLPQAIHFKDAGVNYRAIDRATAMAECAAFLGVENGPIGLTTPAGASETTAGS
jgi:predicted kinase